jgi:hypothetical protein
MSSLTLDRTPVTPEVHFSPERHVLSVRGECYPENPIPFFGQVLATLQLHLASRPAKLDATFQLQYVNSASTKAFRKLLVKLNEAGERGTQVHVAWEHEAGDETMAELGRDLADDLHFITFEERPFELAAA